MIFGLFLGQKLALAAPQELAQQHERHKNVVFLVSGHDGNEEIGGCAQQIDFWPKNRLLGPKRGTLGNRSRKTARRAAKRAPTGKPKLSRVTSVYGGLMMQIFGPKMSPGGRPEARRATGSKWILGKKTAFLARNSDRTNSMGS